MRQYRLRDHGSIDNVELHEMPAPSPGPGQIVMRMRAAALNPRDLMVILGPSPYGPRPGLVPVSDGAGEVLAVGEGVTDLSPGDRVVASFRQGWIDGALDPATIATDLGGAIDGVLAESVVLAAAGVVHLPENLSFEAAATLPCAGVTAYRAVMHGAPIQGATVLIQGTGGVALFALQLARLAGCRVLATTSSPEKAERLTHLGAAVVIDRTVTPDWATEVQRATGGRGVDRIVEVGGAGSLPQSFAAAAFGGEIALVGLLDAPMATISPLPVMGKMLTLRGVSVGSRKDLEAMVSLVGSVRLTPAIDRVFAFEDAHAAFRHLATRAHVGKVVIRI